MSSPTRFAIVGLDHWYTAIPLAEGVAAHPDTELVAIYDENIGRADEVAARTGSPRTTTDWHELINDPTIDVIGSFVSVDRNPEIVIAAAEAGKHIISIKPLALTLAEASDIVVAVRKAGVVFMPGESRSRGTDQNRLLKDWVAGGRLGRITSANFSLSGSLPHSWPDADEPGWWADPKRAPGGGWIDHSLYQIDRMRWLLGEEVVGVSGRVANLVHKDLAFEDYGHGILEFGGGSMVSIEDTWSGPAGGWRITTTLVGTEGSAHIDTSTGRLTLLDVNGAFDTWLSLAAPSDKSVGIDSMLTSIANPSSPLATVEDAWNNFAACVAFYEAAKTGGVVAPQQLQN